MFITLHFCLDSTFVRDYTGQTPTNWTSVNLNCGGSAVVIVYKFVDYLSLKCGNGDGFTLCGPRIFNPIRNFVLNAPNSGTITDLATWVYDSLTQTVTVTY